jgi:hypothetical protein
MPTKIPLPEIIILAYVAVNEINQFSDDDTKTIS